MSLAPTARDAWLAAPRAEALRRADELELSGGFDWSRVERPAKMRGPLLARALPAAAALTVGLGLALGWALTRDDKPAQPSYSLADVADTVWAGTGEAPLKRQVVTRASAPIKEKAVRGRERPRVRKRAVAPVPKSPEKKNKKLEGYAPSVIIVKPPARLPPLFSPEAYRRRR